VSRSSLILLAFGMVRGLVSAPIELIGAGPKE